jgi:hypothetical protein
VILKLIKLTSQLLLIFCVLSTLGIAFASSPKEVPPDFLPPMTVEAWRIRIDNFANGSICVSSDMGKTWTVIGRVTRPADRNLPGYLAAGYAPIGTVAATAVHGIRIRVGDTSTAYPLMINIVPEEFYKVDDSFGDHLSGDSGIYTDIPTGESIRVEADTIPFPSTTVLKSATVFSLLSVAPSIRFEKSISRTKLAAAL